MISGHDRPALITLLTDFGLQDPFVGIMKGVILGIHPQVRLVDLTHGIAPQDIRQARLALDAAWPYFPRETVHLVIVDPGVGTARAPLVVRAGGHHFVGPDNGVFSDIVRRHPDAEAFQLEADEYRLPLPSRTFHGRDIFAPAAAWLSRGVPAEAFGSPVPHPVRLDLPEPTLRQDGWVGEVIQVDVFGNLTTNLPGALIAQAGPAGWEVSIGGTLLPGVGTYAEVADGEGLALVGSTDRIELARRGGSAGLWLKAGPGTEVVWRVRR